MANWLPIVQFFTSLFTQQVETGSKLKNEEKQTKKGKKSGDIKEDKLDCVDVRLNLFFEFISFSFGCSYFLTFFAMYPCTDNIFFFFSLFPSALSEVIFLCCLLWQYDNGCYVTLNFSAPDFNQNKDNWEWVLRLKPSRWPLTFNFEYIINDSEGFRASLLSTHIKVALSHFNSKLTLLWHEKILCEIHQTRPCHGYWIELEW